jgi:hypothetical protein
MILQYFYHFNINLFFLFCRTFEIVFIICVEILIKSKVQLSSLETFHNTDLKLKQSKHIRLFHNIDKTLFIIFYNHCLPKISKLQNQMLNLNNQI